VSWEATQLTHLHLFTDRKVSILVPAENETEMCGSTNMNDVQFIRMISGTVAKKPGKLVCKKAL
jgi:hypothetical protein